MAFMRHSKYGLRPLKRHSIVLTGGGLAYIVYGLMIVYTWSSTGPRASAISAGLMVAPIGFWGGLFIFAGCMAILSARWPVFNEKWGYTALTGHAATWTAVYLGGLFFDDNTLSETGGALTWALIGFLWWATAGLMNPESAAVVEEEEVPPDGRG